MGAIAVDVATNVAVLSLLPSSESPESPSVAQATVAQSEQYTPDPATAVAPSPPPGPTTATVVVTELPAGGVITVDGRAQAGPTFELAPGTYDLRITAPGRAAVETPITVAAGSRLTIPFTGPSVRPTTGTLRVTDLPAGGTVVVDNQRQTSNEIALSPGRHTVQLSAPGFHAVEKQVDVTAGTQISLAFDGPAAVAAVTVSPARPQLAAGDQVMLRARPVDANGAVLGDRTIRWQSEQPRIATVGQDGTVQGVASGTVTVTATVEGRTGRAEITVTDAPVASVTVEPATASLSVGATAQLTAATLDAGSRPLPNRAVAWQSSDPSVATVSGDGLVRALQPGSATIVARSEGQSGSTTVSVKAVAAPDPGPDRRALRQPTIAGRQPNRPTPVESTWNPDRPFSREPTGGWSRGPSVGENVLATYVHRRLGNVRVIDLRADRAATTREAIVENLRRLVESRFSSVRTVGEPYAVTTDAGETVLVQELTATSVSGVLENRRSVIIAAARNPERAVALIGDFEFYVEREQAKQDMLQMIRSLN